MSIQHHGSEECENFKANNRVLTDLFNAQAAGRARREYPNGRIDGDDDGATVYMIANDVAHQVIRIEFPKPTRWIGLDIAAAEALRDRLTEGIFALRGIDS